MDSPQLENGYTKIANEIMEALIATNISGQSLRLTLLIIRKTYGYNKKDDKISLTQMVRATGICKIRCSQVVRQLEKMNILTVSENINGIGKRYSFNKYYNTWRTVNKNINRYKKVKETVNENINPPLIKTLTTKENIKETLTKENIKLHSSAKRRSLESNHDIDICKRFFSYLKDFHPSKINSICRDRTDNEIFSKWLNDIRILYNKGYTREQILQSIKYAINDNFWRSNFYSLSKLNKKNKDGVLYIAYFLDRIKNESKNEITKESLLEMMQ